MSLSREEIHKHAAVAGMELQKTVEHGKRAGISLGLLALHYGSKLATKAAQLSEQGVAKLKEVQCATHSQPRLPRTNE